MRPVPRDPRVGVSQAVHTQLGVTSHGTNVAVAIGSVSQGHCEQVSAPRARRGEPHGGGCHVIRCLVTRRAGT